ncbi:hypothetical protein LIA77_09687 [Sarocladium implicatum]|nr:hypothetical protein LIA77_09687 [Sarocladium implicatum]
MTSSKPPTVHGFWRGAVAGAIKTTRSGPRQLVTTRLMGTRWISAVRIVRYGSWPATSVLQFPSSTIDLWPNYQDDTCWPVTTAKELTPPSAELLKQFGCT